MVTPGVTGITRRAFSAIFSQFNTSKAGKGVGGEMLYVKKTKNHGDCGLHLLGINGQSGLWLSLVLFRIIAGGKLKTYEHCRVCLVCHFTER